MKPVAIVLLLAFVLAGCSKKKSVVQAPLPAVLASTPEPAQPQPPKRVRRAPAPASPARVEGAAIPPLEAMQTPEEKRAILEGIKTSVARAEANMGVLRTRQLSLDDMRDLGRVDSFLRQARSAQQGNDLITARQYAQRAELLSQDLLSR